MTFGGIWPTAASQGVPSVSGAGIYLIFLAAESMGATVSLVQVWEGRDGGEWMETTLQPQAAHPCTRVHGFSADSCLPHEHNLLSLSRAKDGIFMPCTGPPEI